MIIRPSITSRLHCYPFVGASLYGHGSTTCMQIVKDDVSTSARTSAERQKASKIKDRSTGAKRLRKWPFMANLCLLISFVFMYLVYSVRDNAEMARFDPFNLGIDRILLRNQKAYRKMSLQCHLTRTKVTRMLRICS